MAIDAAFDLREQGLTAIAVVALGGRADDDFNMPSKNPKARLSEDDIFILL